MATPTLEAYRQLNPHLANRSDDELLTDLEGQLKLEGTLSQYPDVVEALAAKERAYRQSHRSGPLKELVRSTVGGIDTMQAQLFSAVGQAGDAAGIDAVKNFGLSGYQRNMAEAAENRPSVESIDDIKGVADAAYYGIGLVGSQAPQIAGTLATSAAGGAIGGVIGGALGGPAGAVSGTARGAFLGATAGGYLQSQNYADLALSGGENPAFTAATVGVVSGLLESVVPLKVLRTAFGAAPSGLAKTGIEHLLGRANQVVPGLVDAMQREIIRNGSAEALTEVAQELTAMAGELYSHRNNPNFEISDKELRDRLINSAAAGAILGGLTGVAEGPLARQKDLRDKQVAGNILSNQLLMPPTSGVAAPVTPTSQPTAPAPNPLAAFITPDSGLTTEGETAETPVDEFLRARTVAPTPMVEQQPAATGTTLEQDRARYDELQRQNVELLQRAKETGTLDQEALTRIWTENEEIKNRYGGMPPGEVSGGIDYEQQAATPQPTAEPVPEVPATEEMFGEFTLPEKPELPGEEEPGFELSEKPEFGGDLPATPLTEPRLAPIPEMPALREETKWVRSDTLPADLEAMAKSGIRKEEQSKDATKRLVAIKDNETGTVTLYPVYQSSGHRARIDNGVEAKITSIKKLAEALGVPERELNRTRGYGGQDKANIDQIMSEVTAGTKPDDFLSDVVKNPKFKVLAFVNTTDALKRRQFFFETEQQFRDAAGWTAEQSIINKGSAGDPMGMAAMLDKMRELSPEDAHSMQVFASLLESTPEAERIFKNSQDATRRINRRPDLITAHLFRRPPKEKKFAEWLTSIKDRHDLFAKTGRYYLGKEVPSNLHKGRIFGVFTDEGWENFKKVLADKSIKGDVLFAALDAALQEAGWRSRTAYLNAVIPVVGEQQTGVSIEGAKEEQQEAMQAELARSSGDTETATAEIAEAGELAAENADLDSPEIEGETLTAAESQIIPEKALPIVGLTARESNIIAALVHNSGTKEKPKYASVAADNVMSSREASAEDGFTSPDEDDNFKDVKEDLKLLIRAAFTDTRRTMPNLTDDFLYGIYANLDKAVRDSNPMPSTYRVTNDTITRIFHNTVAWLGDRGVDVRLIQRAVGSHSEFLKNEWGRSISTENGSRMVILSLNDYNQPSRDNLRVLFHEVAHQMFADEPKWMQRLLHEAIDRLGGVQLAVFSKTLDKRLTDNSLSYTELMEEVLSEHLGFQGVDTGVARSWAQRFIDGLRKVYARALMVLSEVKGNLISPQWALKYMELRFRDMLDKVVEPKTDFENMTGTPRNVARYRATFYAPIYYVEEKYDSVSGQFIVNDVVDESLLASELNLDNKLTFSDQVIRDTRWKQSDLEWGITFGITENPISVKEALSKVLVAFESPLEARVSASALIDSENLGIREATVKLIGPSDTEIVKNKIHPDSPAFFDLKTNTIFVRPEITVGLSPGQRASLIVHEAAHAATARAVSAYHLYQTVKGDSDSKLETVAMLIEQTETQSDAAIEKLKKNLQISISAIAKADKIFKYLQKKKFAPEAYGMSNLDEFLSEVLSNRAFQIKLAAEKVPENLAEEPRKDSIFTKLIELFRDLFHGMDRRNAYAATLAATERILMTAGVALRREGTMTFYPAAPVNEQESDDAMRRDFEYEFAALNSQADYYHSLFDEAARLAGMEFDQYLTNVLGIFNPEKSLAQLKEKAGSLARPITINQNLRLSDIQGAANRVVADVDRKQITDRLLATASTARGRISKKSQEFSDNLPRVERDFQRAQERMIRFETMLHDVVAIRDNALKILRKGLKGAERGAARLARWSTRLDGLPGVAAELYGVKDEEAIPEDYVDLITDSVEDHEDDFFVTDVITAAQAHGVDFDLLRPADIEFKIQEIAARTRDARLLPVADGSPQAKADLALVIYYAKTSPEDMLALAVRVERDPERKDEILRTIKKIIQGNYESATGLNDLFKSVRKGDVRVGKAQQSLTNALKQLRQTKKQMETSKLRIKEMERAAKLIDESIKKYQADISLRAGRFEPYDGAQVLLTGGEEPTIGTLKLGPSSKAQVVKILMDNVAWLRRHTGPKDPLYLAIEDQAEGLKRVAHDHALTDFKDSFWKRHFGSIPERMASIGLPILKSAANRWFRYFALRQQTEPIVTKGLQVTKKLKQAMKATGFKKSYGGFKDTFWNPANHFIQHLTLLPGATQEENRAYVKEQMKLFFLRSAITRDLVSKPDVFDLVWDALQTNASVSKEVANQAAAWKVFVEDAEVNIRNPRTGRIEKAQRPALDVGLFTTQASISKVFSILELLHSTKNQDGEAVWPLWMEHRSWLRDRQKAENISRGALEKFLTDKPEPKKPNVKELFSEEVIFHFVRPYVYDTSTLHFPAPTLLDGKTRNRANPINVQQAWEASNNDVEAFAIKLFELEDTVGAQEGAEPIEVRAEQYVQDIIGVFTKQYQKIRNLSEAQSKFNGKGMRDQFLTSPMMDSISIRDFPPEFIDYAIYDQTSLKTTLSQLAAHSALGRDLGMFSKDTDPNGGIWWELQQAEAELRHQKAQYDRLTAEAKRTNPFASTKEIDAEIGKKVGKEELHRFQNLHKAMGEVHKLQNETVSYFTSPNGSTLDMQLAQTMVGTLASAMVNNFKSVLNSLYIAFEPFMVYGVGSVGQQQVKRTIAAIARSSAGTFIQGMAGQAVMASNYARYMNEHKIGRDPANETTAAQVMADTGKNNVYENEKLLGWLRKGRSVAFDLGFRGAEGERVAPKFRVFAPFSMMSIAQNQGAMEAQIQLVDQVLKLGMAAMEARPGARTDPAFEFSAADLNFKDNIFDTVAMDELKDQFKRMGTSIEIEVRSLLDARDGGQTLGEIVVPPDLARLAAAEGLRLISLPSDISSSPSWLTNNALGRISMPLISWSLNKTNQLVGKLSRGGSEAERRVMIVAIASLALGMVPAAVLISMLTDQYDERILGKKSNLIGFNFNDPSQTAAALMERVGRVGTFGLAGDLVNGVRVYGTSGDLRGISIDQRVVFVNTLMSMIGLASTVYNQEGTLTYDTFYRPLINTLGGGGIIQNQQILNNITNSLMGTPIFTAESETTARINALNYLRGAGRVTGLDVRTPSGMKSLPNPTKPWVNQMVVASYGNNPSEFISAYRNAVESAREEGRPEPEDYVKRAYQAYHPLRYTFKTPPTKAEVAQMMSALSDKGRQDVAQALQYFNSYASSLGLKPYDGKETIAKKEPKSAPNPWGTGRTANPWQ